MTVDMLTGKPIKRIFIFALPLLLGNAFQQFYTIADSIIVGRLVGADGLAAVSTSGPIFFLLVSAVLGLGVGATIAISQYYGAGMIKELRRTSSTALIFLIVTGLLIGGVGFFLAKPLLLLLKTDADILTDAVAYLRIIAVGLVFNMAYNAFSALMTATGDSRTPLYFLIIATLLNIALDIFAIAVLGMGVAGAALATIVSQGISALLCFIYMYNKIPLLRFEWRDLIFDTRHLKQVLRLGLPASFQQSIIALGSISVQGLVNSFGKIATAAYGAGNRIEQFAFLPVMSFGNAIATFTGQNIGAGKKDRVQKGLHATIILVMISALVFTPILVIYGESFMKLFLKPDEPNLQEIVATGVQLVRIMAVFTFLVGLMFTYNSLLRGAGDVYASTLSSIANISVRIIAAYTLALYTPLGLKGIWYSLPLGWAASTATSTIRYYSGVWKTKSIVHGKSDTKKEVGDMPEQDEGEADTPPN